MHFPRMAARPLLIAVAIIVGGLGFELLLYRVAADWVSEHPGDDTLIIDETMLVWAILTWLAGSAISAGVLFLYVIKWLRSLSFPLKSRFPQDLPPPE